MILRLGILAMVLNSKTWGHFHSGHAAAVLSLRWLPACEWSGEREECSSGSGRREERRRRSEAPVPRRALRGRSGPAPELAEEPFCTNILILCGALCI